MTTIASVTYDRAAFWRRTALRSQEQCVQYLERIEEQDTQMRRMQDLILELNKEAVDLQAAYENRGRRIADLEEEYATAMGQVNIAPDTRLDEPIDELNLSTRTRNALMREGIATVGALVKKSPSELIEFRNFGVRSLDEVEEQLAERDLDLAPNPPEWDGEIYSIGAAAGGGVGALASSGFKSGQDLSIQK